MISDLGDVTKGSVWFKIKSAIVKWLVGDDPYLMNFTYFPDNANGCKCKSIILIPNSDEVKPAEYYKGKAILVPNKNILDNRDKKIKLTRKNKAC